MGLLSSVIVIMTCMVYLFSVVQESYETSGAEVHYSNHEVLALHSICGGGGRGALRYNSMIIYYYTCTFMQHE